MESETTTNARRLEKLRELASASFGDDEIDDALGWAVRALSERWGDLDVRQQLNAQLDHYEKILGCYGSRDAMTAILRENDLHTLLSDDVDMIATDFREAVVMGFTDHTTRSVVITSDGAGCISIEFPYGEPKEAILMAEKGGTVVRRPVDDESIRHLVDFYDNEIL